MISQLIWSLFTYQTHASWYEGFIFSIFLFPNFLLINTNNYLKPCRWCLKITNLNERVESCMFEEGILWWGWSLGPMREGSLEGSTVGVVLHLVRFIPFLLLNIMLLCLKCRWGIVLRICSRLSLLRCTSLSGTLSPKL